jgi:signal transduction histidine kinase
MQGVFSVSSLHARTQEADVRVKNAETLQELASARLELFAEELSGTSEIIPHSTHSVVPRIPFQIFDHVCRALRPRAVQRNIIFDYDANANTPLALPRVFSIVPFIILENAIKYSPDGARIKINAREDGTRVQLSIISNGPTIEEDEKDRIFERNGRGRNAIGSSAGNGLGLFTAQRIVKVACQGTLTVECSQVANGRCTVTFITSLPIIPSGQAAHLAVR